MKTEVLALNTTGKTLIVVTDNNYTTTINPNSFIDINVADLKDSRQVKHMLEKGWLKIEEIKEDMYLDEEKENEDLSNEDAWEKVREIIKNEVEKCLTEFNTNQNDKIELLQNQIDALICSYTKSIDKVKLIPPKSMSYKTDSLRDAIYKMSKILDKLKELC